MRVGLIDVDNSFRGKVTHPNLALMKLSGWHKNNGDTVEWVVPLGKYDRVYAGKVFGDEYTKENFPIFTADEIIRGGSGYAITIENGREVYHKEFDPPLPVDVDHTMPDYSIYGIDDTAYGFLTKGCPRGCDFCHVAGMQGRKSVTVARLSEFWNGQKNISLCDPNILACKEWEMHFDDLIKSGAYVDFNQGMDIRLLTDDKIEKLNLVKFKSLHFAWDRPEQDLRPLFINAKEKVKRFTRQNVSVYILTNNGSTLEQDIERVEFIKSLNIRPYVMVYRAETAPKELKRLRRYANNPFICWATPTFADYKQNTRSERHGKTGIKHNKATTIEELQSKEDTL